MGGKEKIQFVSIEEPGLPGLRGCSFIFEQAFVHRYFRTNNTRKPALKVDGEWDGHCQLPNITSAGMRWRSHVSAHLVRMNDFQGLG